MELITLIYFLIIFKVYKLHDLKKHKYTVKGVGHVCKQVCFNSILGDGNKKSFQGVSQ